MSPTLTFLTNFLPICLDTAPLLKDNAHMKHALQWIIETFYPESQDLIWDNPEMWEAIFDLHIDAYLESPDFKEREALRA